MNAKIVNISISMPVHLRDQVRLAAKDDNRSVSSLVCSLLRPYLRREGYSVNVNVEVKVNGNAKGNGRGEKALEVGAARSRQTRLIYS